MKRFLALGVSACIADTSDPSAMEDTAEDTAETQGELKVVSSPPIDLRNAEENEREEVLKKSLTDWRVYIRGACSQ